MRLRGIVLLSIGLSLLLVGDASAKRKKAKDKIKDALRDAGLAASAADIPALAKLLDKAGWTPTPEMSGAFQAGVIFQPTDVGHRTQLTDCFDVEPTVRTYTSAEVVTQLQVGVSVPVGVVDVSASGALVKKMKFGTPSHVLIPRLDLMPTDVCHAKLERAMSSGMDISTWYVVQEVLLALIAEQTCGRIDARGRIVGLGAADAEFAKACAQESLEPVAVGYRTVPLSELIGDSAPPPVVSTPAPVPVGTPAQATASVDFGGGGSGLGVAAKLKQQRCDDAAKVKGERARSVRLDAAASEALAKARSAWQAQEGELKRCAELKRAKRGDCIAAVEKWLGVAKGTEVLPAGVELVETDCGTRQPTFDAVTRFWVASDLAAAKALLARLMAAAAYRTVPLDAGPRPVPDSNATSAQREELQKNWKACNAGDGYSCFTLGAMYRRGEGVPKSNTREFELNTEACDGLSATGCAVLGIRYRYGQGVAKDEKTARAYDKKACDLGMLSVCAGLK